MLRLFIYSSGPSARELSGVRREACQGAFEMEQETWADEVVRLLRQSGDGSFYRLQYFSTVDSTNEAVKRAAYAKADPTDEAAKRADYAKADPTNEDEKRAAQASPGAGTYPSEHAGEGLVIIGEEQTAGKWGRRWSRRRW